MPRTCVRVGIGVSVFAALLGAPRALASQMEPPQPNSNDSTAVVVNLTPESVSEDTTGTAPATVDEGTVVEEAPGDTVAVASPREEDLSPWWWVLAAFGAVAAAVALGAAVRRRTRADVWEYSASALCDGARRVLQRVEVVEAGARADAGYPVASAVLVERLTGIAANPASGRRTPASGDLERALARLDRAVVDASGAVDPMVASAAAELDRVTSELERAVVFRVHDKETGRR